MPWMSTSSGVIDGSVWVGGHAAKLLKRVFRQPRPTTHKRDYGMPSSHSQSLFFFLSHLTFVLLWNWSQRGRYATVEHRLLRTLQGSGWLTLACLVFLCGYVLFGAYDRVAKGHHTREQVLVGAAFGTAFGAGSFFALHNYWY